MPKSFKPIIFIIVLILIDSILFCGRAVAVEKSSNYAKNDYFYCTIQSNVSKIHIIENGKEHIVKNNQNKVFNISIGDKKVVKYTGFSHTITKPRKTEKVHIVLRWDSNNSNLGIKTNYAELSSITNVNNNVVKPLKFDKEKRSLSNMYRK